MRIYESKLLTINPDELSSPKGKIPFSDFIGLVSCETTDEWECGLRKLAKKLPYKTSFGPGFGDYTNDWYTVEISEFTKRLLYCERGSYRVIENCENLIDLSYQVLNIVSPVLTRSAEKIAENLDRIDDQRLHIWLRMSSGIYHMYQVNNYFGVRMLNTNVTWMCEELVRMGVFENTSDAFKSEKHIVKGLILSGLPKSFASNLYRELHDG